MLHNCVRRACITGATVLQRSKLINLQHNCSKTTTTRVKTMAVPDNIPKYISGFNDIPELENASEMVQAIFLLENGNSEEKLKGIKEAFDEQYDTELEREIAFLTNQIRSLEHRVLIHPENRSDKFLRRRMVIHLRRRTDALRELKEVDLDKYNGLLEEYQIVPIGSLYDPEHVYKSERYKRYVTLRKGKMPIEEYEDDLERKLRYTKCQV